MSLIKVRGEFQVTIPEELRKAVRLGVGDFLEATAQKDRIVLKPKSIIDQGIEEAIEEGLCDLRAGRMSPAFASVKEFKQFIKKGREASRFHSKNNITK